MRPLQDDDLPGIADLYRRVYPERPAASLTILRQRLEQILLHHPWRDEQFPSLVYEDATGAIAGFLGVMPRPMRFNGRSLTAAVSHSFLVAPGSRSSLAALQLARRFLEGPQDLSLAEGNDRSRRLWEGFGGSVLPLYSLSWMRPLRPGRYALDFLRRRGMRPAVGSLLRPLSALLDGMAPLVLPKLLRPAAPTFAAESLRPSQAAAGFAECTKRALRPEYDTAALVWLLEMLRANRAHGELRHMAVADQSGVVRGWYVYYLRPDGMAEILQLVAASDEAGTVFDHVLHSARLAGASAVSGALDPALLGTLAGRSCLFHHDGHSWMLVHSRQAAILMAFHQGKAFLSRLDGEWWITSLLGYH
ncbi:MAG: GNAT family N-acetyltransferase [Gammaproteobacteria bacterium]